MDLRDFIGYRKIVDYRGNTEVRETLRTVHGQSSVVDGQKMDSTGSNGTAYQERSLLENRPSRQWPKVDRLWSEEESGLTLS